VPVFGSVDGGNRADTLTGSTTDDLTGADLVALTSSGASLGEVSSSFADSTLSTGLISSFLLMDGLGDSKGFGRGDGSASFSIFSNSDGVSCGVSTLRRPTGFSCRSLMGDVLPEPKGSAGEALLPRSTLLRCCLIRLISAIHAGCAGGGCLNLGESGLLRALSSQLDFVGLHRFEGLGGDVSSCGCSFSRSLSV
jgi:hypothetical protein